MQTSSSQQPHENRILDTFAKMKPMFESLEGWNKSDQSSKYGIVNYTRNESGFSLKTTRGEGILPYSYQAFVNTQLSDSETMKYNSRLKQIQTLAKTPSGYEIKVYTAGLPIGDDRDVFQIKGVFEENGSTYIVLVSIVDDKLYPERKGVVRAFHNFGGYKITPAGENKVKVIFISNFEPKGSIPEIFLNKQNNSRGIETIQGICDFLAKQ